MDTDEQPIASGRAADWHPRARELSCALGEGAPSCTWYESAHLPLIAPPLTFLIYTSAERSRGTSPSCPVLLSAASDRVSWERLAEYSQGMSKLALGKTPCAPVIVT